MGADDKISAGMDNAKGQAKEAFGKATDNDKLVAEGKMDQAKGDLRNAGENVKDAAKDMFNK